MGRLSANKLYKLLRAFENVDNWKPSIKKISEESGVSYKVVKSFVDQAYGDGLFEAKIRLKDEGEI